ncbi:hypothetical protein C0Q70_11317 [Pomacea canaliculata]|uniref:Reverse transcriptase/retrotransposon-derived protein RNase H-like domain-containing protein n=1 Tax=Pomacea canaliculata TaxID=400727 RepID=A0A2T7P5R2_POMCA|nr:hypothetical protein C0Q70_11317 [Pomacea canaliculata]
MEVTGCMSLVLSVVGIGTNVVNWMVFRLQGLKDRMNLCLFFLAMIDIAYSATAFANSLTTILCHLGIYGLGEEHYQRNVEYVTGIMYAFRASNITRSSGVIIRTSIHAHLYTGSTMYNINETLSVANRSEDLHNSNPILGVRRKTTEVVVVSLMVLAQEARHTIATSGLYTMVIAIERCVCVTCPLRVMSLVTTRTMGMLLTSLALILQLGFAAVPMKYIVVDTAVAEEVRWRPGPSQFYLSNRLAFDVILDKFLGVTVPLLTFIIVSIATAISVLKLRAAILWREKNKRFSLRLWLAPRNVAALSHPRGNGRTLPLRTVSIVNYLAMFGVGEEQKTKQAVYLTGVMYAFRATSGCYTMKWPVPKTVTELCSFLGFARYYWRRSLRKKRKRDRMISQQNVHQAASDTLKSVLSGAPVLGYTDCTQPFIVETDASNEGLDAILSQVQEGRKRVISNVNRRLRPTEQMTALTAA